MSHNFLFKWKVMLILVACVLFISAGSASGAGFALLEQSVSGLGNAYAGGAASAEDATTIFYNPAGLTRLDGQQIILGSHVIVPYVKFENEGSTHLLGTLQGDNDGDAGVAKIIPNLYYNSKIGKGLSVGLGINAPFGLATKYDRDWVGRYHAIESDVLTVNINPTVSYKVIDNLSVGVGLSAQYLKAKLSNAIDFGTIGALLGLIPQQADGNSTIEGDSWGYGYNAGLLYEFSENTRAGLAYRSRIKHKLEGEADFSNVPSVFSAAPTFKDTDAEAEITLPDSASISFFHQFSPQWMVMADVTWTNWSLFEELKVEFDNPNQPDNVTTQNWQDTYRYALGLSYAPTSQFVVRAGAAYDTSAVSDKEDRTPRIPEGDRIWAALGAGYKISKLISFDIGYAHLFINDPEIDKTELIKDPTHPRYEEEKLRGGLKGSYSAHIDIVSVQLNVAF